MFRSHMQDVIPKMAFYFSVLYLVSFSLQQEEELRKSGEAKYGHLSNDLHVLIEVFAPPGEAYTRMSSALDEIKKFLVPVSLINSLPVPVGYIHIMYFTPIVILLILESLIVK